jgi:outer membrane protein TolC
VTSLCFIALASALTLDDTRAKATERALEVAAAEARAAEARGLVWTAAAGGLPRVDLFASGSVGSGLTSFGFERPVATQAGLGVTGAWTLIAPSSWAAADAARHSRRGADALLAWARVTARRDATTAYADLAAAVALERVWTDAATDADEAARAVEGLVAAGLRPEAEAVRSRARAATVRARALQSRADVVAACAAAQILRREPVDGACTLDDDAPVDAPPAPATGDHPAWVAADEALAAASLRRASAWLSRAPTVAATGTAAHYLAGDAAGFGWSTGVEARMPVLSGGAGVGALVSAGAARDDAQIAREAQRLALDAAVVTAQARFDAAEASLAALALAVDAADEALRLTEGRYRQGLDALEAWLDARAARDDARAAYALGQAARLRAVAELEAARGVW